MCIFTAPYLVQEANCGVSYLGFHIHAQKVLDLGALWILDFQVRDVQPVLVRTGGKCSNTRSSLQTQSSDLR